MVAGGASFARRERGPFREERRRLHQTGGMPRQAAISVESRRGSSWRRGMTMGPTRSGVLSVVLMEC